jgi:hypothetical protein
MVEIMVSSAVRPYLQFGEVQWWYFPDNGSGMPFYDEYTQRQFQERYGRELRVIPDDHADPAQFIEEVEFLPTLIGDFTDAIIKHVRSGFPSCRFEVLYPTDVNATALNRSVNFPAAAWTPETLDSLKTESFSYTLGRDLNKSRESLQFGREMGFAGRRKSHLVGISDPATAWQKEFRLAEGGGLESVVLFALDQFCLVGYPWPAKRSNRRSLRLN